VTRDEPTGDASVDRQLTKRLPSRNQLVIEMVLGLVVAVLLMMVGWASSNAIRFVYGGY
jgi:hypothetical protein